MTCAGLIKGRAFLTVARVL